MTSPYRGHSSSSSSIMMSSPPKATKRRFASSSINSSSSSSIKPAVITKSFVACGSALLIVFFFQVLLASMIIFYQGGSDNFGTQTMFSSYRSSGIIKDREVQQYFTTNEATTQTPEAAPLPTIKDERGRVLFNPESFRIGDRGEYINEPVIIQQADADDSKQKKLIPKPIGLKFDATTSPSSSNDVVVSVIPYTFAPLRDYNRLVASLRGTGYNGHIILGIRPDETESSLELLQKLNVTLYTVATERCSGKVRGYKDRHGKPLQCFKSVETLPLQWGRYELARQWIAACKTCTGKVLLALDGAMTFFQANPFEHLGRFSDKELLFAEELGPHTDPFYYDPQKEDTRHIKLSKRFVNKAKKCYNKLDEGTFGFHRPILTPSNVVGSRDAVLSYLSVLSAEFETNIGKEECRFGNMNENHIMNYLYYSGAFGTADKLGTMPWGTGIFQGLEKPCRNDLLMNNTKEKSESHLDIVRFDFNTTGYIVNRYEPENSPLWVAPVIHHYLTCDKWIKAFFKLHGELNGHPFVKPDDFTEILQYSIRDSVMDRSGIAGSEQSWPMKTSYQKATVVQQAPWFSSEKICKQTCCAESIAISLDADNKHLITSADGLDLAEVGVYGHIRKEFLQWAISDLNFDIIPCLQSGTIIYADHEGGGVKRFFDIYRPKITEPYLLVTGGTDGIEPLAPKGKGKEVLQTDDLLIRWYGINGCFRCGADQPKFKMMHLGLSAMYEHQKFLTARLEKRGFDNPFADSKKSRWIDSQELSAAKDTTRLMFVKFNINAHSQHRQLVYDMACKNRDSSSVPLDEISCSLGLKKFHNTDIYNAAEKYLFGLSPPGNGLDCYRTYELYFLGVIPVVKYSAENLVLFQGLPLLQLNDWNITQQQLVDKMRQYIESEEFKDTTFNGWDRLFLKYWRHSVLNETGRLSEIIQDDTGREYYKSWQYTRYRPRYEQTYWPPKLPMEKVKPML